jgi:hypothetical protein
MKQLNSILRKTGKGFLPPRSLIKFKNAEGTFLPEDFT